MNEMNDTIMPEWLTLEGAARYCGLSTRTLESLVKDLHVVSSNVRMPGKSRGRRLLKRASLDAFIESGISGPAVIPMNVGREKQ
ncbi:helix-turn-helix domain-containing protein [Luteolibacter yonseiensis]|uniref:Helix-turn-helix domain-containing protein n=1 Tax=Luteolibacter yonseiensis TaxID=1144680 RepID=A0A934R4E3_9BACT|nr:helix-turn-helix domain-containing protein [Luteolibacter yonseiensis]MBK1815065.1 helix-turn-helix domain-containing protein [Luteolibacter yonseiensis]